MGDTKTTFESKGESTGTPARGKVPGGHPPERPAVRVRGVTSLDQVDRDAWDALGHGPSPFLSYGFLRALEVSESIGEDSGWHPFYLLAELDEPGSAGRTSLIGAVAAFVKSHSYGEYIFDWSWAGAAERAGLSYYPKLVIAAPMSPATGPRLLLAPNVDPEHVTGALVAGVRALADQTECSSVHWLFCTAAEQERLAGFGFAPRASFQFHWHNQGYASYDDFLSQLSSRKRKQLRKERRRALEQLDGTVTFVPGKALTEEHLSALDRYYRTTVFAHGGMDYLRPGFFHELARQLPEAMQFAQARRKGHLVAGALFLETSGALYGRYWGCDEELELLHFETAYYAGIERCIERGIPLFEAGAQGEHKLLRGFVPSPTYSCHWIRHPGLREAVYGFLDQEARAVARRMEGLAAYAPYRCEDSGTDRSEE